MAEIINAGQVGRLGALTSLQDDDEFYLLVNQQVQYRITASDMKTFFAAGAVDLGYTSSPTDGTVTNSAGTDAVIPAGSSTNASLMLPGDKTKLDGLPSGAIDAANLSYTASATDGVVNSDVGTDATIPAGDTVNASLMLPGDKTKLDGVAPGAISAANLSYTASPTDGVVNSDVGTDATIPAGDTTDASLMLPGDKTKLDGIPAGAIDAANLAYTASPTDGTVTSDVGTDATIPAGDTTDASLMLPADKTKLDTVSSGATPPSTGVMPYQLGTFNSSQKAPYASENVGSTASAYLSFTLPTDFSSLSLARTNIIPNTTNAAADIDIIINSHLSGELFTINSVTDNVSTYNFTINVGTDIDFTFLFNLLPGSARQPGSRIGVEFDHNGIGGALNYISCNIEYVRT